MRELNWVVRLIVGLTLMSAPVWSQGFRATVVGRITDQTGAVVPGVQVTIVNVSTNDPRSVISTESGDYTFPQLAPGSYELSAELPGFKKEVRRGILLETGQEIRIDLALSVGNASDTVEVSATAPLLASENATLGNVVEQKKIVELPLNGRDYLQLAQLQPNVFAPAQGSTVGFRGGFNVAGSSEVANNFLLDGVDNNDETTNQPLHKPVLDAILEFKVLTGTYPAEYGRQSGGQIVVSTKSGSNDFHGSAFEFYRDSALDAREFFATQKSSFRRNQFGGVLGGPVRRDRTFFFAAYEGQRRGSQEANLAVVPIEAFKRGDFSSLNLPLRDPFVVGGPVFVGNWIPESMWSKQGAGLLALFPNPNRTEQPNFASAAPGKLRANQFSGRVDHRQGEKDSFFGAYQFAHNVEFYPSSNPQCGSRDVPGYGCDEPTRTMHLSLVWTHILSPNLVNEARVGYNRFGQFRLQEDRARNASIVSQLGIKGLPDVGRTPFNTGAPEVIVAGYSTVGGPTNQPQGRHDNTYHYIENMTWSSGRHTAKWGFDIRRFLYNSFLTTFGRGSYQFDGRFTGNAVADLLLGLPFQADRNLGEPFHNMLTFNSGYYFQDDWKISQRLTLNLGLRYELFLPPVEKVNKISSFDPSTGKMRVAGGGEAFINPAGLVEIRSNAAVGRRLWKTDKNNFAPRVGLAWRPFGDTRTVIRAGFGTYYNLQIVGNGLTPLSRNTPFRQRQTVGPLAAAARPLPDLADMFSTGRPSVIAPGIDPNFLTTYINQWSFGVQRELAKNLVLDLSYLGSEGHKLPIGWNINQAFPGPGSVASRRPFAGYGNIIGGYISSIGNSSFNSLQVRAERRFDRGLSFVSSYTWSKSIDQNNGISSTTDSGPLFAQNARNLRAERASSDFDVSHRWVLSYVYDVPIAHSISNRLIKTVLSGWVLTGVATLQTGRPFTVLTGTDTSNTGGGSDRPNLIGDWRVSKPGPGRWFNPCTLLADGTRRNCAPDDQPAWQILSGAFGNAGRNIVRGDGLANVDFGLYREFPVREGHRLQFRSEFFNIANHPNFFFPVARASSSAFGKILRSTQSGTGSQRQIEFALKYIF